MPTSKSVAGPESDDVKDAREMLRQFADYLVPNIQEQRRAAYDVVSDLIALHGTHGAKVVQLAPRTWAVSMEFRDHRQDGHPLSAGFEYTNSDDNVKFKITVGNSPDAIDPELEYDPHSRRFVSKAPMKRPDGTETRLGGAAQVIKKIWETTQKRSQES